MSDPNNPNQPRVGKQIGQISEATKSINSAVSNPLIHGGTIFDSVILSEYSISNGQTGLGLIDMNIGPIKKRKEKTLVKEKRLTRVALPHRLGSEKELKENKCQTINIAFK